ncbi:Bch2 protein [Martiniozyma asiatica (nom. inval.)]|nr:Bch2 protein [Martiniozyma asiatica]
MTSDASSRRSSSALKNGLSNSMLSSHPMSEFKARPQLTTPRIKEKTTGEALQLRAQSIAMLQDLGPPDLVHFTRYDKSIKKEIGEYHYAIGINTSSQIQPFIYLQTVQLNDKEQATKKQQKIGTYSSYNIFSKGDLRIRCQFPSNSTPIVQFHFANKNKIPLNLGNESEQHLKLWEETYVSSLIRAILFPDDLSRQLPGLCKFNPIQSTKDSKEAVKLLCKFLPFGSLTGCNDIFSRPNQINNYLVDALIKLVDITGYHEIAIQEVEEIIKIKKINLKVLLARLLINAKHFAKASKLMHESFIRNPRDGWMLIEQCQLLISKGRPDLAFLPALRAVECLPTDFNSWKILVHIYILKKDFKNALLALNSSPMYVNRKKDIFKAISPDDFSLPEPNEGKIPFVWESSEYLGPISGVGDIVEFSTTEEINSINQEDLKFWDETKLNSTFYEAYDLIAVMAKQLGWIELLKLRTKVFVMEDEYDEAIKSRESSSVENADKNSEQLSPSDSLPPTSSSASSSSISTGTSTTATFKSKRLSEKWLDSLFLIFYNNLKRSLIWMNELSAAAVNEKTLNVTGIQWEIIAQEMFYTHKYPEGVVCYAKALQNRFSIFAAEKLLKYWLIVRKEIESGGKGWFAESNLVNEKWGIYNLPLTSEDMSKKSDAEILTTAVANLNKPNVLDLLLETMSWKLKYYGEFSPLCVSVLRALMNAGIDGDYIKSRLNASQIEVGRDTKSNIENSGMLSVIDRLLGWVAQFED